MEALVIIGSFCTVCGILFLVVRVVHPTRKEFQEEMQKQRDDYFKLFQSKESCNLFHATQDVRNTSFVNTMASLQEDIKEIRKDIKEALNHIMGKS